MESALCRTHLGRHVSYRLLASSNSDLGPDAWSNKYINIFLRALHWWQKHLWQEFNRYHLFIVKAQQVQSIWRYEYCWHLGWEFSINKQWFTVIWGLYVLKSNRAFSLKIVSSTSSNGVKKCDENTSHKTWPAKPKTIPCHFNENSCHLQRPCNYQQYSHLWAHCEVTDLRIRAHMARIS